MSATNTPQLFFYLVFYFITIMLRFMRVYAATLHLSGKESPAAAPGKAGYFYFGFDLVNVAAGVFILLAQNSTAFLSVFFMVYMAFAILGLFLDIVNVPSIWKASGHVVVSTAIIGVTVYAFAFDGVSKTGAPAMEAQAPVNTSWNIAIPYYDMSLISHFSPKKQRLASVYTAKVTGSTRAEAVTAARKQFESENGPRPFNDKLERSQATMIVLDQDIVAEQIPPAPAR